MFLVVNFDRIMCLDIWIGENMEDRDLFLTDSEIHGIEEDIEVVQLREEVDRLKEKLEDREDRINTVKKIVNDFIKLNLPVIANPKDYSQKMVELYKIELNSYKKMLAVLSDD